LATPWTLPPVTFTVSICDCPNALPAAASVIRHAKTCFFTW